MILQVTADLAGQAQLLNWVLVGVMSIIGGMSAAVIAMWSYVKNMNKELMEAYVHNTAAIEKMNSTLDEFREEFRRT